MHNLIGIAISLLIALGLIALFGLVWLAGTIGDRLTRLFQSEGEYPWK